MRPTRRARLKNGPPFCFCIGLAGRPAGLAAQTPAVDPHAVQPERPTVSTHAGTVAAGWLEIEAGTEGDRYADGTRGAVAPVLFKLGLAPRLQLSVQVPIVQPPRESAIDVGELSIGVKWRLVEAAPIVGDFAMLPSIKVPSAFLSPATRLASSQSTSTPATRTAAASARSRPAM